MCESGRCPLNGLPHVAISNFEFRIRKWNYFSHERNHPYVFLEQNKTFKYFEMMACMHFFYNTLLIYLPSALSQKRRNDAKMAQFHQFWMPAIFRMLTIRGTPWECQDVLFPVPLSCLLKQFQPNNKEIKVLHFVLFVWQHTVLRMVSGPYNFRLWAVCLKWYNQN